ncbi:MAG: hypothetical protein Kow0090_04200 [Myxococcota bacterium]
MRRDGTLLSISKTISLPANRGAMNPPFAKRSLFSERGLTLVEISISLLILVLVMGVVLPSVTGVTKARLKSSAGEMASAIRYMYDFSVMNSVYCRMVFELDEEFYYTECSEEPIYLKREKELAKTEREVEEERQKKEEKEPTFDEETFALSEEEKESWRLQHYKPQFTQVQTETIRERKLPSGVFFEGIWTMHQREIFRHGEAQLYFFPQGFVERAHIYLSDSGGKIYTLTVNPLLGKVKVDNSYIEPPRE